jgi:hypothetical protein
MTVVPNFLGRATTNMMKKDLLSTTGRSERPENQLTATPLLDRAHVGWGETLVDVGWVIASEWKFSSGGWQSSFSGIIPLQLWNFVSRRIFIEVTGPAKFPLCQSKVRNNGPVPMEIPPFLIQQYFSYTYYLRMVHLFRSFRYPSSS